ncbi:MAG: carbon storage regulator [Pirellulales bacterium]
MLVLSRKECEKIRLGDNITITVVRVAGDKVRLGIEAPSDVLVLRKELKAHEREPRIGDRSGVLTRLVETAEEAHSDAA